jgi:cell division protein FtsN
LQPVLISPAEDSGTFMANYERGVYEPSDDVRVFDGSEEEEDVEGSRLPLLIVLALLVLAMFAGVVWLAYTQGVARGRGETPVLAAAGGPERVAPPQDGSSGVPYQGFKIYEQPAPPDDSAESGPATVPAQAAQKPAPATLPPQAPPPKPARTVASTASAPKPAAAMVVPAPAKSSAPPAKSVASLIQQADSVPVAAPVPKQASSAPALKQTTVSQALPAANGAPRALNLATAAPAPAKTVIPVPTPAMEKPAPAVGTAKPAAGTYVLQIGAYKSQADAEAAWKTYKTRHAALVAGYSDNILQADLGEKGIWYRLRIGGLSDKEVATALCDRLKADGGACIPGK